MNIISVTLNPAYDTHYVMESFSPFSENYALNASTDCGGKGINISRVLNSLSVPNKAYVVLGRKNSLVFENELLTRFPCYKSFYTDDAIRENITLHSHAQKETRISLDNFSLKKSVCKELFSDVLNEIDSETYIAFAGRIPKGILNNEAIDFLINAKKLGAKLCIDCNSFSIDELTSIKPWFIKPNETEIRGLCTSEFESPEDCAIKLYQSGIENVMITLGEKGCVFMCDSGLFTANAAKITPVSTIGAGDSTIAGFLAATYASLPLEDKIRYALACGSSACLTEGTAPPKESDINRIFEEISILRI